MVDAGPGKIGSSLGRGLSNASASGLAQPAVGQPTGGGPEGVIGAMPVEIIGEAAERRIARPVLIWRPYSLSTTRSSSRRRPQSVTAAQQDNRSEFQ